MIGLLLVAVAHPALACSIGTGIWEKDLAEALSSSEEVFVARLLSYQETPPPAGGGLYFLNQANYELIEIIKGRPDPSGTLSESNPYHPIAGQPPGPSCGPWLVLPDRVGTTAVVFAFHQQVGGKRYLWANPFSSGLDIGDPDSDAMLNLIRKLQLEKENQK